MSKKDWEEKLTSPSNYKERSSLTRSLAYPPKVSPNNGLIEHNSIFIRRIEIKIKNCPPGLEQKNCDAFQEDSLAYKVDLKYAPERKNKENKAFTQI